MALDTSPRLQAERARLRGIEELPIQALNQRRPQVRVAVDAAAGRSGQSLPGDFVWEGSSPVGATISLSQPLLTGGSVQASYREGQLRVAAGVARMRALQFVLIREVLVTYADVLREHDILDVRIEGAANLAEQLAATEARQAVGLIGLTDVAQARTRLESARGQEALARSRLMGAWARLEQLIGTRPTGLTDEGFGPDLPVPATLEAAVAAGLLGNHDLLSARLDGEIARAAEAVTRSQTGVRADLTATYGTSQDRSLGQPRSESASVGVRVVVPIWSGGQPQSRERAAAAQAEAARFDIATIERQLVAEVTTAWYSLEAADLALAAAQQQVEAAGIARTGARLEQDIGARTTLELLNQEQEWLEARVALISARREATVARVQLLTLIGSDPLGLITLSTEFDLTREQPGTFTRPRGRPAVWERPLILLHDVLSPVSQAADEGLEQVLTDTGREE